MSRTQTRELLMQMVFQMEAQQNKTIKQMQTLMDDKKISENEEKYIEYTFKLLIEHLEDIDNLINENSKKWKVNRMPKADLAIVRLAICETIFSEQIPKAVAINEAVNLAKNYGSEQTPKFVNGLLGKIADEKD